MLSLWELVFFLVRRHAFYSNLFRDTLHRRQLAVISLSNFNRYVIFRLSFRLKFRYLTWARTVSKLERTGCPRFKSRMILFFLLNLFFLSFIFFSHHCKIVFISDITHFLFFSSPLFNVLLHISVLSIFDLLSTLISLHISLLF